MQYDQDTVRQIFRAAQEAGATDVHFKVPGCPRFRVEGRLIETPYPPLKPPDTMRVAQLLLGFARQELPLASITEKELSFGIPGTGRFRAHVYRQRGSLSLVVHRMAIDPPRLAELGADASLGAAIWERPGLTLVTGQGLRLATLAALVDDYNRSQSGFLIALEQPLEYLHSDRRAVVSQREVGQDTPSFAAALQWAMTGDVDALTVSDLPDGETAELALRVAETGRRVVACLVGCPPQEAVGWFIRLFPPTRAAEIEGRLRRSLRCLVFERKGSLKVASADRLFAMAKAS